jgi:uncharacterized membrane protein
MTDFAIALALHVLAIVLWIGGVALVTTVALPAARRCTDPAQGLAMFEAIERRFAPQARISVLVAGASGLYMLYRLNAWPWFASAGFWWLHAMVLVWLIFAALLYLLEPLILHRRFAARAHADPTGTLLRLQRFHMVLLALSVVTILGAVAGANGLVF